MDTDKIFYLAYRGFISASLSFSFPWILHSRHMCACVHTSIYTRIRTRTNVNTKTTIRDEPVRDRPSLPCRGCDIHTHILYIHTYCTYYIQGNTIVTIHSFSGCSAAVTQLACAMAVFAACFIVSVASARRTRTLCRIPPLQNLFNVVGSWREVGGGEGERRERMRMGCKHFACALTRETEPE
jgi:hypothetical protein